MALGDMTLGAAVQPQGLEQWLQTPEGKQAVANARMQSQAQMVSGEGGSGMAAQSAPIQIQTPYGPAQYVSNGSGGGQIIGGEKQWNQDYQTSGQRAERPTFEVTADGNIGRTGFNETRGGGVSGTNNQLATFAALAAGGALAGGAMGAGGAAAGGGGSAAAGAGAAGAGGAAAGGSGVAAGMEAAGLATAAGGASGAGGAAAAGGASGLGSLLSGAQGYGGLISAGLGAVAGAANSKGTDPYKGQLGAPANQYQNQAAQGIQRIAQNGDPTANAGSKYTQNVLSGQYLNSNPYLDSMYQNAAQRITDSYAQGTAAQTDAMFAKGGAFGGSAHANQTNLNQRGLGDALSSFAANLYGNNYAQERQNQQQAANQALGYGQQNLQNWQALGSAGSQLQAIDQNQNQMQYDEFRRQQGDRGTGLLNGIIGGAAQGAGIYGQGQKAGWW